MLSEEHAFDWLINRLQADFTLIGGTLPAGDFMCFPSLGYFAIPVVDHPPAIAVPLSFRTFVTLYPRDAVVESGVGDMVRTKAMIANLSMLGGGLEHKIILPAPLVRHPGTDPDTLISLITEQRTLGRRMFNLIGEAACVAGMRGFGFNDEGHLEPIRRRTM